MTQNHTEMNGTKSAVLAFVRTVESKYSDYGVPESVIIGEVGPDHSVGRIQSAISELVDAGELRHERTDTYFINDL